MKTTICFTIFCFINIFSSFSQASNKQSYQELNLDGKYTFCSNDSERWRLTSVFEHLTPFKKDTICRSESKACLEIKMLDKTHVMFNVIIDTCIVASKKCKYKMVKSELIINKRNNGKNYGLPPFFFTRHAESMHLSVDTQNNLQMKCKGNAWGMLFFLTTGVTVDDDKTFVRIN